MSDNSIGSVALKVTLSKENIANEAFKIFKDYQAEVDKNTITYKIAGDKSSLDTMLKQIQGMTPELLTKLKLDFDKSDYDKEMSTLKGVAGKTAKQIGEEFKSTVENSLKGFDISQIIGKKLKKDDLINTKDIVKVKDILQSLKNQTDGFDLTKVTSVKEINDQVIALNKMKVLLDSLSKHTEQKSIKMDGKAFDISQMLQQNTSQIDNIMQQAGSVIHTNASKWMTDLESTFNSEYSSIISMLENLTNAMQGVFNGAGTGSGSSRTGTSKAFDELGKQIDEVNRKIKDTETELENLNKLVALDPNDKEKAEKNRDFRIKKQKTDRENQVASLRNKIAISYNQYDDTKGKNELENFKTLVNEYMKLGGLLKDLTPGAGKLVNTLKIEQFIPNNLINSLDDANKQIEELTAKWNQLKETRDSLIAKQSQMSSQNTGSSGSSGSGQGTGTGTGTSTTAVVSPKLSEDFKAKLQEQVTNIGSVNATVSGKLSETFKEDVQTNVSNLGTVSMGVSFSNQNNEGDKKQEIPVDVIATPKLSDTFRDDLQKKVDDLGTYKVSVELQNKQEDSSKNTEPTLINVKPENTEEFKSLLKSGVEGEAGLDIKVNPVVADDYNLEIKNATLKDVKVEGDINGGILKPATVETPVVTTPVTDGSGQDSVNAKLDETKKKEEEVGNAAEQAGEKQKKSLLEVIKEYEKLNKESERLIALDEKNSKNNGMQQFFGKKQEDAKKFNNIQELITKIQSKVAEKPSKSATNLDKTKQLAGIVAYVERLKELMGKSFSYDILGENGEAKFKNMKQVVDAATKSVSDNRQRILELNQTLINLGAERDGLLAVATDAEKLEAELYDAIKAVEKLKGTGKKQELVNVDSKSFTDFFEKWKQYKAGGGTRNISEFTQEAKVINSVTREYDKLIEAKAEEERKTQNRRNLIAKTVAGQYSDKYSDIDKTTFDGLIEKLKQGTLTAKEFESEIVNIRESLKAVKKESETPTPQGQVPKKPTKLGVNGEINVVPKIEDPTAFANKVTEQLKGVSAEIDVKPNLSNTSNNNAIIKTQEDIRNEIAETEKYIEREKQRLEVLNRTISGDISFKGKKEATDSLKHLYSELGKQEAQNGRLHDQTVVAYNNVYNAAKKLGVAQSTLDKNFNPIAINSYSKSLERVKGSYEVTQQSIDLFTKKIKELNSQSAIGQEAKSNPIQIPLEADIQSLNTSIQSKKDQILPVDVVVKVDQTTLGNLTALNTELGKIIDKLQKITDESFKVNVDYSSIEQLFKADKNGVSTINSLKNSIDGLQTGVLKELGTVLSSLDVKKDLDIKITNLAIALGELKEVLNNISPDSNNFLTTLKELSNQASGLKDLATVIRASKEEIQKAKGKIADGATKETNPKDAFKQRGAVATASNKNFSKDELEDREIKITGKTEELKRTIEEANGIVKSITSFYDSEDNLIKTQIKAQEKIDGTLRSTTYTTGYSRAKKDQEGVVIKEAEAFASSISSDEYEKGINEQVKSYYSQIIDKLKQINQLKKDLPNMGSNESEVAQAQIKRLQEQVRYRKQILSTYDISILEKYKQKEEEILRLTGKDQSGKYSDERNNAAKWDQIAKKQAEEYQSRENEYIKERNRLIAEGKKQEEEYYKNKVSSTTTFNNKDQIELYNSLSKAVQQYVYWLNEEKSATGSAKETASALRSEAENLMNSLRTDIKSYGLQNLEKELDLDRQILEARRKINYQDEVSATKMAKASYERELKLEEKKNKLQINNIGANSKTIARNNVRIAEIDRLIKKEQEYRDAMGLSDKAQEVSARLINIRTSLTQKLKIEQEAYNESVKASNQNAENKMQQTADSLKTKLEGAISEYFKADSSKLTEAQNFLTKLSNPTSNWNVNSDNINSVIKKIETDTNKIINALKTQHEKIEKETLYSGIAKEYEKQLNSLFTGTVREGAIFKEASVDDSGKTILKFLELVNDKAREVTITLKDANTVVDKMQNGTFDLNSYAAKKSSWRNATKAEKGDSNNITGIVGAYDTLIQSEEKYQKLVAKRDTATATANQLEELERLTLAREKASSIVSSIPEGYKLDPNELKKQEEYNLIQSQINEKKQSFIDKEKTIHALLEKTNTLMSKFKNSNIQGFDQVFERAKNQVAELNNKLQSDGIKNIQTGYIDQINKIVSSLSNVVAVVNTDGLVTDQEKIAAANQEMLRYANTLNNGNVNIGNFTSNNRVLTASFETQKGVIKEVSLIYDQLSGSISLVDKGTKKVKTAWQSFMDGLKTRAESLAQYLMTFVSFYRIWAEIRQGITYIKEFDTALVEMRKVSDETISSLKNFQKISFDIADSVGTTAVQIQNSTADWMRLGESIEEASESAQVSNILLNVSEFENIDDATDSLVAMSAAYSELDKMEIVDKLNEVGNNYAISTDGIATALQDSASALTTAGNSMDEAIALVTAGNAVVQDPNSVGSGLRTIALRLTGTKESAAELEELGEDTEGVITTVSKLRDTIMSATAVASNDFKGFDIFDENGNYKSTYEILKGISEVYQEIVETDEKTGNNNKNLLLETIAGKNRANIAASILQNPELLTSVYDSSANDASGSAQEELEKYLDSIEGKIAQFQNEVQEFWHNLISSDTVKGFVDFGTKALDIIGKITDEIGLLGTIISGLTIKSILKNSGGRAKLDIFIINKCKYI